MADEIKDDLISEMFARDGVTITDNISSVSSSRKETYINDDAKRIERRGKDRSIEQIAKDNSNIFERAAREMAELEKGLGEKEEDRNLDSTKNPIETGDREDK